MRTSSPERPGIPRRPARLGALLAATAVVALLSGCMAGSGDAVEAAEAGTVRLADASPLADPHDWEGPSTALLPGGGSALSVEAGEPELPATVTSHDLQGEREVEVDAAERILGIDISGSVAQTIFALGLGERVVGRDISTTIPEAAELPVVTGDGHTVEAESVIALQPDVVVTDGSIGPDDVVLQLRDVGISVVYVDPGTGLDAPAELARQVGAALGVPDAGEELARSLDEAIEAKAAEIAAVAPADPGDRLRIVFLYIRGGSGIYYLFGAESGADSLIEALGGIDIAGEQGWTGMRPMTDEALVAADPDLILVMTHGLESTGGVEGLLEAQPSVALTTAGEKRRIVDMEDGQILAFGPRTPEVLDALAVAIYAPDAR